MYTADGKQLQRPSGNSFYECEEKGMVTDASRLLVVDSCPGGERNFVRRINPGTGVDDWTWKAPEGVQIAHVLSVDPAVIVVNAGESGEVTDVINIDDKGRTTARISLSQGPYKVECTLQLTSCQGYVVDDRTLYVSTAEDPEADEEIRTNKMVAIDLRTGERRWDGSGGTDGITVPVAMRDGELLGYRTAQGGESGRLLTFDVKTGKSAVLQRLPAQSREQEESAVITSAPYYWNDQFYLIARASGLPGDPVVMAFR